MICLSRFRFVSVSLLYLSACGRAVPCRPDPKTASLRACREDFRNYPGNNRAQEQQVQGALCASGDVPEHRAFPADAAPRHRLRRQARRTGAPLAISFFSLSLPIMYAYFKLISFVQEELSKYLHFDAPLQDPPGFNPDEHDMPTVRLSLPCSIFFFFLRGGKHFPLLPITLRCLLVLTETDWAFMFTLGSL